MRNHVAKVDLYMPHTYVMDGINCMIRFVFFSIFLVCVGLTLLIKFYGDLDCLGFYEYFPFLRQRALDEALAQIRFEDENTKFLDIGPVRKTSSLYIVGFIGTFFGVSLLGQQSNAYDCYLACGWT
jgi:lanosterol synthase